MSDLTTLIRRDHDELGRQILALTDPATSRSNAYALLQSLQVGFSAHTLAQSTALREVVGLDASPRALGMIVQSIIDEHRRQARLLTSLVLAGPGTNAWHTLGFELREQLFDHATREEFMRASLSDHVSKEARSLLATRYATERMRVTEANDTPLATSLHLSP